MADAVRAELIGAAVTMAVDHVTEEVVGAFDRADVPSMLLKGPSIARWLYPAGGRGYRDTDLLVRPEDFGRAAAVLRELGFGAPSHALVDHAHTYARGAGGYAQSVDLHRTLPYVAAPPADVWRALHAGHDAIALGEIDVDVLGVPQRCLHIAIHALQHAFEARGPFEDLRRAVDAASFEEWAEAASISRRLGAEDALAAGLCLVPQGEALSDRLGLTAERRGIVRIAATVDRRASGVPGPALSRCRHFRRAHAPPRQPDHAVAGQPAPGVPAGPARAARPRPGLRGSPVRRGRADGIGPGVASAYPQVPMTDHIVARSDDLETRAVEDELVLLDLRTQTYLSLNRTGAHLWPLMVEGTDRATLIDALCERHDVPPAVAERDVDALVAQLREADLLLSADGHASPDA